MGIVGLLPEFVVILVTDLGWVRQHMLLRNSRLVRHLTPPPHTSHSPAELAYVQTLPHLSLFTDKIGTIVQIAATGGLLGNFELR
jgi:hypothetical protein